MTSSRRKRQSDTHRRRALSLEHLEPRILLSGSGPRDEDETLTLAGPTAGPLPSNVEQHLADLYDELVGEGQEAVVVPSETEPSAEPDMTELLYVDAANSVLAQIWLREGMDAVLPGLQQLSGPMKVFQGSEMELDR